MFKKLIAILLVLAAIYWSFLALLPTQVSDIDTDIDKFSTARALVHLREIAKEQHPVGSEAHATVREYIIEQLEVLGLETQIQEEFSLTKWGNLTKPKNIIGRLKGREEGKAVLLLSHYDSAPHSSFGASDDGAGIVTIIEGLRAFLQQGKTPKNDIIVLISDAEELGLNGADIFVNKHEWAKEIGVVLNFEARGSGGPSFMLVETNGGNSSLIEAYKEANPSHPVGNSLAYSIYKLLPNDTDLTRFREDGNIDGFNFAFIDDHFDYHTSNDNFERLDRNTLEHQGTYMMAMLSYFSEANLNHLKNPNDSVYFNVPMFKTVSFSFGMIWPLFFGALLLFGVLIFLGFKKRRLNKDDVVKGFAPLFISLIVSLIVGFVLWEVIKLINPGYYEMLHGFTYNGYTYILAYVFVTLGICSFVYSRYYKPGNTASLTVAPTVIWLLICVLLNVYLKGASFLIVPVYFALVSLFLLVQQRKPHLALLALLSFPLLFIMSPFVQQFPVGLGFFMKIGGISISVKLISMLLVVLTFVLMMPLFGFFRHKRRWAYVMLFIGICLLLSAQSKSNFNEERPKPNSLVYLLDVDTDEALWATYDRKLDDWTKQVLGEDSKDAVDLQTNVVGSKYNSGFTYVKKAPRSALVYPEVEIFKDTVVGENREVSVYISSKRNVQRIELFSSKDNVFISAHINGVDAHTSEDGLTVFSNRRSNRLFTYFVVDKEPLEMKITIPKDQKTEFTLFESSNDLLTDKRFGLKPRPEDMIAKPFILNDAIIIKKTITIN